MAQSNPTHAEFTRLRSIVLKRLKRIKPDKLSREAREILKYGLPTIKDIRARHPPGKVRALSFEEELQQYIEYFRYLYNKPTLSASGQKTIVDKRLETLNLHYIVNDLGKFGMYMEKIREFYGTSKVASAEAAEYYSNNPQIEEGDIKANWDKIMQGFDQYRESERKRLSDILAQAAEVLRNRLLLGE